MSIKCQCMSKRLRPEYFSPKQSAGWLAPYSGRLHLIALPTFLDRRQVLSAGFLLYKGCLGFNCVFGFEKKAFSCWFGAMFSKFVFGLYHSPCAFLRGFPQGRQSVRTDGIIKRRAGENACSLVFGEMSFIVTSHNSLLESERPKMEREPDTSYRKKLHYPSHDHPEQSQSRSVLPL